MGVCVSGCADVVSLYLPGSSLVLRGRCDMLVSYDASLGLGLLAKLFYVIVFFFLFLFLYSSFGAAFAVRFVLLFCHFAFDSVILPVIYCPRPVNWVCH